MKATLLVGSLPRIVIPVARSLQELGIPVYAASSSKVVRSRSIRSFVFLGHEEENPELYFEKLKNAISEFDIDTVMPCGDEDLLALSRHDTALRRLVQYCGPTPSACRKILEKTETLAIAESVGIPVPHEYKIIDREALSTMRETIQFPVVVKPRHKDFESVTEIKSEIAHSFEQLVTYFDRFPEFGSWFLIQDFIPGTGVAVEILMDQGLPIAVFQHRRMREYPVRGGVSVAAISEAPNPELVDYAVTLLRALDWQGVAMVEFRKDDVSGRIGLMEVNGRFWGSVALSRFCGVNFPYYLWQIAHGQTPEPAPSYPVGTKFRWLGGDLRRLYECFTLGSSGNRLREVAQFIREFPPGAKDSTWSWNDPLPAIEETARSIAAVGKMAAIATIRNIVPGTSYRRFKALKRAGIRQGASYLQRRYINRSGTRINQTKLVQSVVFICYGNIIRSPMAEAVFRGSNSGIRVGSAGTSATPGKSVDARAAQVAREFDVSLDGHRARRLSPEIVESTDLLVVMDYLNYVAVEKEFPEAMGKVILLAGTSNGPVEIDDPYDGTLVDIRAAYRSIDHFTRLLAATLKKEKSLIGEHKGEKVTR